MFVSWLIKNGLAALLVTTLLATQARAATRRVNADGSGDYPTMRAALEGTAVNGGWTADGGADDELILSAGTFDVNGYIPLRMPDGKMTIKGDAAGQTWLRMTPGQRFVFTCVYGNIEIRDLVVTSVQDVSTTEAVLMWGAFGIDPSMANRPLNLTLENIIVTENLGAQPRMDWSNTLPTPPTATPPAVGIYPNGYLPSFFGYADNVGRSPGVVVARNCVFAYGDDYLAFLGIPDRAFAGSSMSFEKCLFVGTRGGPMFTVSDRNIPLTFQDCAFVGCRRGDSFYTPIRLNTNVDGAVTVRDSLFINNDAADIWVLRAASSPPSTNVTIERVTSYKDETTSGAYALFYTNFGSGLINLTLKDAIVMTVGGPTRPVIGFANDATLASLTLDNIATPAGIDAPSTTTAAAFAALYNNTGPLTADPQFEISAWSNKIDGARNWDRSLNNLFDVTSPAYAGRGTAGGRANNYLAGGADGPFDPENLPINRAGFWAILD